MLLYGIISVVYWILALFITYHIRRYLLNAALANSLAVIFLLIMLVFFLINLSFFLSLPLEETLSKWNP